jgi:energy-coupling factor transport system permease protein
MKLKYKFDPRTLLLLYCVVFFVGITVYDFLWDLLLMVTPLATVIYLRNISVRRVLGPLSLTVGLLALVLFLANLLYYPSSQVIYNEGYGFYLIGNHLLITLDGFTFGIQTVLRFVTILLMMACLTEVIPVAELVDALYKIKLPSSVTLALGIGLSYIPVFTTELNDIQEAQQARGWAIKTRNPLKKGKAWAPLLIPAIKSSMRRSELLASSMESRGFRSGYERVSRKKWKFGKLDYVYIILLICIIGVAVVYGNWGRHVAHWTFTGEVIKRIIELV